jgi:hypothetical protein
MPSAVEWSPSTKLESGYPPTYSLLYIVHSGGQKIGICRPRQKKGTLHSLDKVIHCSPVSTISIDLWHGHTETGAGTCS